MKQSPMGISKLEKEEMETLLSQVDDDFGKGGQSSHRVASQETDMFIQQLARVGLPEAPGPRVETVPPLPAVKRAMTGLQVLNTLGERWKAAVQEKEDASGEKSVAIVISSFKSKEEFAAADIQVRVLL